MKRLVCLLILICAVGLSACSSEKEGLNVIVSTFPEYDCVQRILGDQCGTVSLVMDVTPLPADAEGDEEQNRCDVFFYEKPDKEVADVLCALDPAISCNLREALETKDSGWTSPKSAISLSDAILDVLCEEDPEHAGVYQENAAYIDVSLRTLEDELEAALEESSRTLVCAGAFPFSALAADYDLQVYDHGESDPRTDSQMILALAAVMDQFHLPAVLLPEGGNTKVAEAIIANTADGAADILNLLPVAGQEDRPEGRIVGLLQGNVQTIIQALGTSDAS